MSSQHNITTGPIAPQNNPPINPQYYQPRGYEISGITLGSTTTVTTSTTHDFVVGQLIRILILPYYGSYQLNEKSGYVISIPASNQVTVTIDSTNTNAFIASPTYTASPPQIIPIGDINSGAINSGRTNNQTYINGTFINISPN